MTSSFAGRTVVVTGAFSGIGGAARELLVAEGAQVHALDIKPISGDVASSTVVDLRDPASIDAAVAGLPGKVDALFNCAGLPQTFGPVEVISVNFLGLRHLTEALVDRMGPGSAIASVASVGGLGWPDLIVPIRELLETDGFASGKAWVEDHLDVVEAGYRFSKSAVIAYTMYRSTELVGRGIRINSASPGDTSTPMTSHFRDFYGADFWESRVLPIGRPAEPVEQARALLFLNRSDASYISGVNLVVDAGATAARTMGHVPTPAGLPGTAGAR
jgi:NAD(P)-dependent dehydrogenase (short-subunit alcohol dehydrogenase family)